MEFHKLSFVFFSIFELILICFKTKYRLIKFIKMPTTEAIKPGPKPKKEEG